MITGFMVNQMQLGGIGRSGLSLGCAPWDAHGCVVMDDVWL